MKMKMFFTLGTFKALVFALLLILCDPLFSSSFGSIYGLIVTLLCLILYFGVGLFVKCYRLFFWCLIWKCLFS